MGDATHPAARRWAAGCTAAVAVGLAVVVVMVRSQTDSVTGLLDLRIYLGAASSFRDGASIYDYTQATYGLGSTYPPAWTLLLVPVAGADVHLVELVWSLGNTLLWLATLRLVADRGVGLRGLLRWNDPRAFHVTVVWLLTIPSAPVWNTLNQGQINVLLWFLLVVDLRLLSSRGRRPGLLTGVATALKLVPGVFVAYYLAARRWRATVNAVAAAAVVTLAAAALAPSDSRRFWTELLFDTERVGPVSDAQNNSLAALFARAGVEPRAATLVAWAVALPLAAWSAPKVRRAFDDGDTVVAATVIGSVAALLSPISWTHHLVFLCFPLVLLLDAPQLATRWWWPAIVGAAVLLVDPGGFGRWPPSSTARALVMIGIVVFGPRVAGWLSSPRAPAVR